MKFRFLPKINKYRAKKTTVEGKTFHSQLEAKFYVRLLDMHKKGEILCILRQVPIDLPGNIKYLADFMAFYADGTIIFFDVKGKDTPVSILKRKQVAEIYPFDIVLIDAKMKMPQLANQLGQLGI